MLEYISYRKYKKYKAQKEAREAEGKTANNGKLIEENLNRSGPVLSRDDEAFLESILSDSTDDSPPPLPVRPTLDHTWTSDDSLVSSPRRANTSNAPPATIKEKEEEKEKEKEKRRSRNPISLLLHRKDKEKDMQLAHPRRDPAPVVTPEEAARERDDLNQVLDDLNLSAQNNKAFALSPDSNELVRKFTLVLKDLVNGVPTAIDDLKGLIEDRDGVLKKNYDRLPSSMKKLVAQLPDKMTQSMGPEVMAAAAKSQGVKVDDLPEGSNMKDTAKSLFMPKNLQDIITKPTALIGMLKAIVNFLKLRWPAFIGLNVVWSVAIFLLLLVLWYCHKRGREVRLERERSENAIDGSGRVEELPDDPMLSGPPSRRSSYRSESLRTGSRSGTNTPRDDDYIPESPRRRRTHR